MSSVCTPAFRVSELRRRKITFATRLLFPHLLLEFKIQSVRKEREREDKWTNKGDRVADVADGKLVVVA